MASGRVGPAGPRGQLLARILAATVGAYAAGWVYTIALSLGLIRIGVERSNAVAWATLTSYAIMIGTILFAFCVRSTVRLGVGLAAWLGVLVLAATMIR